jgi:biotin-(acetyl-CoA carboxylase) ligase
MLIETRAVGELERVVVGLGLNWRMPPELARSLAGLAAGATPLPGVPNRDGDANGDAGHDADRTAPPSALPAGGLFDELPEPALRERITGELAASIIECTRRFFELGFADTAARWARFDVLAGREVAIVLDAQRGFSGRAQGLDRHGALLVRTEDGIVPVAAGDVSVRFLADTRPAGVSR